MTSLRFFAAFGVVLFHLSAAFAPVRYKDVVQATCFGGATGVSFFFILSGFVLTWADSEARDVRQFFGRRFARVYPSHVLTWALAFFVGTWEGAVRPAVDWLYSLLLVQAWLPRTVFVANGVSWSLSCELLYYATFPVAVMLIRRVPPKHRRLLMAGLLAVPLSLPFVAEPFAKANTWSWISYFPPSRLPEFLVGIVLALEVRAGRWPRLSPKWAGTMCIAAALATGVWQDARFTVCIVVVPFVLLIGAVAVADVEGRASFLQHPALLRLGIWSFALYLVHQLVIRGVRQLVAPEAVAECAMTWIVVTVISLLGAAALYHFWERPLERRLRPAAAKPPLDRR